MSRVRRGKVRQHNSATVWSTAMARSARQASAAALALLVLALGLVPSAGAPASALSPAAVPPPVAAHALGGKLSPAVAARLLADPTAPISVIVHVADVAGRPPLVAGLGAPAASSDYLAAVKSRHAQAAAGLLATLGDAQRAGHVQRMSDLWLAHAVALTADTSLVADLAGRADVLWVSLDGQAQLDGTASGDALPATESGASAEDPLWNVRSVQADRVWQQLGIDGAGVTVGVIDSGVDYHHPGLVTRYRGYVAGAGRPNNTGSWWCPEVLCGAGASYPWDAIGHGTHVAGTVLAGDGVGVAPGARWVAALVCPDETQCIDSWIVAAMQWLAEPSRPADLRPGVMNGSFSTPTSENLVYKTAVDELVAAGIVVVAAAGNNPSVVGAPASYPAAIAVGAVTDQGKVWRDSGRGRSLGTDVKPEVVAPGVGITSTVPGGGWSRRTGTSMAAPHVAGVAALLRQARPELTPENIKDILKRTASPLLPNNVPQPDSGWGTVNAFAAVASVLDVGTIRGRVFSDPGGAVIPWARVRLAELNGDPLAAVDVTVADGSYELTIRPGSYLLTAEAFTFKSQTRRGIEVRNGTVTTVDFPLPPDDPMGTFSGGVYDQATGAKVAADIRLAQVPERFVIKADGFTGFSQRLPAGTYEVRVERFGYRVITDTVKIVADDTTLADYRLQPAPRILVVDGDGWAYRGGAEYLEASLERLGYLYHLHRVTDQVSGASVGEGPPTAEVLAAHDLVIWTSPFSSPGFVHGAGALGVYLYNGGRLLLTGQDALCQDAGTDVAADPCNRSATRQPYVQNQLFARVLKDSAGSRQVVGTPGGPLDGLTFELNGPDSMDNQNTPDALAPVNALNARLVASYGNGLGAGVLADTCLRHRAVALGFGFEGIAGGAVRDRVLGRLVDALMAPTPLARVQVQASAERQVQAGGQDATYTLDVYNTGSTGSDFDVSIVQSEWPASVWNPSFTTPLAGPFHLGPCEHVAVGVKVAVPAGTRRGISVTTDVLVQAVGGGATARVHLTTTTPAPVLVVDGDFFRNSEGPYLAALDALAVPYDRWELGLYNNSPSLPPADRLAGYPAVVWFTGYDWRPTGNLSLEAQRSLAQYLEGGGRLLLASEDFLMSHGATPFQGDHLFRQDYLGVAEYLQDQGGAHQGALVGAPGSLFDGLGGCSLPPMDPDDDISDRLTPAVGGRPALLDALGGSVAVQFAAKDFKTAFLAFDAGRLNADCAQTLVGDALDWFSPLTASRLAIQPTGQGTFGNGDTVRLRLSLVNRGPRATPGVRVRWNLPPGVSLDEAEVPAGWHWVAAERVLTWTGDLAVDAVRETDLALRLAADLPERTRLSSWVEVDDGQGLPLTRRVAWQVNAADLSASTKAAPGGRAVEVGDEATFVVAVVNNGNRPAGSFVVTDTLPAGLALVPSSVAPAAGTTVDFSGPPGTIVWRGNVEPGRTSSLSYRARVTTYNGGALTNVALLDDGSGQRYRLVAQVFARPQLMLPVILRQEDLDP
jgi:uncharacterized repeat protein (TIGR01451 family)